MCSCTVKTGQEWIVFFSGLALILWADVPDGGGDYTGLLKKGK